VTKKVVGVFVRFSCAASDERKFLEFLVIRDRVITEGIFSHCPYGINSMGSHANQVDAHERWLTDYVLKLKSKL
jgi:hypothetical protein